MDDSYIMKLWSVLILTTLPVTNQQDADYRLPVTIQNLEDTTALDKCRDEVIQPVIALFYEEDGFQIITDTACNVTEYFNEMCYAEAVCSIPKGTILEQRRTTCSNRDLPLLQFRYNCITTTSFHSIRNLHVALRQGTLTSPNFPGFHSNPVLPDDGQESMLRCTLSREIRERFQLQKLVAWVTLNGSGESGQFTVEAVGLDNSPGKVESNTDRRQFLNFANFEAQELEQLNLTFKSTPADAKFILEFTATEELIVCCSQVNETNEWPDCRGEVMNKKDKQADVKDSSTPLWVIPVAALVAIVLILAVLAVVFRKNQRVRECFSRKKSSSKYQAASTSGGDSPRQQLSIPRDTTTGNNNYDCEQPVKPPATDGMYALATGEHRPYVVDDVTYAPIGNLDTPGSQSVQLNEAADKEGHRPVPQNKPSAAPRANPHKMPVYAQPDKSWRPRQAPPPPKTERQLSDSAPPKPARLHQGIVQDSKRKLSEKLDLNTGTGPPSGERESTIEWGDPNPVYEASKNV